MPSNNTSYVLSLTIALTGCTVYRTSPILDSRKFKENGIAYVTGEGTSVIRGGPYSGWATCVLPPAQTVRTTTTESSGKAAAKGSVAGQAEGEVSGEGSGKSSNAAQVINEYSESTLWAQRMLGELCIVYLNGGFGPTTDGDAKKIYIDHVAAILAAGTGCQQAEQKLRAERERVEAVGAALAAMPVTMTVDERNSYVSALRDLYPPILGSDTCVYEQPADVTPPDTQETQKTPKKK
jgi:hypothetical protein